MTAQTQPLTRRGHPGRRARRLPRPSDRLLYGLIGFVILLPLWELITALGYVKRVTISSPSAILAVAWKDFFVTGYIWPHLTLSIQEYLVGFLLAAVTGIALGLALGMFRRLQYLLDPWLDAIYATPTIALVPLIVLVFGIGFQQKVVVIWLEAIFVITVSVMSGVHAAEKKHIDTAFAFKAGRRLRFTSVIVPSSVPFVLTGMRLGATRALVGVVVAEFLSSNAGIGFYINFSGTTLRTDRVMLGVILLGLFGIGVGELIRRVEKRFEKWRPAIR
jgi:NitT/TauT family transport system permease protein